VQGADGAISSNRNAAAVFHGAYSLFFAGTALIGVPALLLCLVLAARRTGAAARAVE